MEKEEIKRVLTDKEVKEIRREVRGQRFLLLFSLLGGTIVAVGVLVLIL